MASGPLAARAGAADSPAGLVMRRALEAARRAALAGEPPIGACLVRDGEVLAVASNCVVSELDITAHAEMTLIRDACIRPAPTTRMGPGLRRGDERGCDNGVLTDIGRPNILAPWSRPAALLRSI